MRDGSTRRDPSVISPKCSLVDIIGVVAYISLCAEVGLEMQSETPEEELGRLRKIQRKTRHDEVFGGLSREEREEYDGNEIRIRELDRQLALIGKALRLAIP